MAELDPASLVQDSHLILDDGQWPNFHDAEVHRLSIWRGDIRPEDEVWIGPVIEVSFELCALREPYIAELRFHDCEGIRMADFNHQNALFDLQFGYEGRGRNRLGEPLPPFITVRFEQAFGVALSFRCFRIQALRRLPVA